MDFANIVATVFTAIAGWASAVAGFRRTIGRRRDAHQRIGRLSPVAQVSYFSSVLGQPTMKSIRDDGLVEYIYVDSLFYVHVLAASADDTVQRYAVTTRSRWFHPTFTLWTGTEYATVRLGKSKFAGFGDQPSRDAWRRARRGGYAEGHYFGNPGYYQTYILALNDAGSSKPHLQPKRGRRKPGLDRLPNHRIPEHLRRRGSHAARPVRRRPEVRRGRPRRCSSSFHAPNPPDRRMAPVSRTTAIQGNVPAVGTPRASRDIERPAKP